MPGTVSLTWHLHLLEYSQLVFDTGLTISRISGMSSEAAEKAHGLAYGHLLAHGHLVMVAKPPGR